RSRLCWISFRWIKNNAFSLFSSFLSPDEHNDVQKKTFTKWINARFSKVMLG
uniref:Uncharacterized protein n=1 Tax=Strix occidentalis caurina TaxID=311401 RepID=A0A8D0KWR6_STROC